MNAAYLNLLSLYPAACCGWVLDLAAILSNIFPALVYQKAQSSEAQHDELFIERIELAKGWNVEQSATK